LALELLDAKFADQEVRKFATKCLEKLTDAQMAQILLQLVQVLKYEPNHSSPLSHFLLKRSLQNRNQIGFNLYWLLRSEMYIPTIRVRYGVLLEAYLRGCGEYRGEFEKQLNVLKPLEKVAMLIKETPKEGRMKVLVDGLAKIKFPASGVQLPIDPRFVVNGLIVPKCKYMDSKKLPLWLVFKNVEPKAPPIFIIFKVGDDLRQDIFTLQLIRIMDNIWKNHGFDLRLSPYRVTATGDMIGMVEVVLNSETTGKIMKSKGNALNVIKEDSITNFLKEANPTQKEFDQARHNFCLSCAGYCVATYVLGIGDRHSDNIMVKRTGEFFHIDFGHFLGNFKTKYGVKRERAPFKFTPHFANVLGGVGSPLYQEFAKICSNIYSILRNKENSYFLINLFCLMLSTGIPELQTTKDIEYLQNAFSFEMDNVEASEKFQRLITEALNTKSQTLNDFIHAVVH